MKQTKRYIDPTTDYGFKRIFGTEANKDLLIDLLNELFRGRKDIVDLTYNKNEHVGTAQETGTVIFDLTCTAADGEQLIIEVQRIHQQNLKQRMLYYGSKLIADQAPNGNRKGWNYNITEVYVIVIMDGIIIPGHQTHKEFLHDICLCDRGSKEIFYEELGFIYIELRNFAKNETELSSELDKWLFVLKNLSNMNKLPGYLRKPIFEKLFNIAEYSKLKKEERAMYDVSLKRKWDEYSIEESRKNSIREANLAKEKARQEGKEEGRQEGREEGIKEGIEKGKKEGREEELRKAEAEKRSIASELKKMGIPVANIAKATGLSIEEIEKLK